MPLVTKTISRRYFNQIRNGVNFDQNTSAFTPNLVGNVGEVVQMVAEIGFLWYATGLSRVIVDAPTPTSGMFKILLSGSALDAGFTVGDSIQIVQGFIDPNFTDDETTKIIGDITLISDDGKYIEGTNQIVSLATGTYTADDGWAMYGASNYIYFNAANYRFSVQPESDTYTPTNILTEAVQAYYCQIPSAATNYTMTEQGSNADWRTGSVVIRKDNLGKWIKATITHTFIILPFASVDFSIAIPDLLDGNATLKHSFEVEILKTLTDYASSKVALTDNIKGAIGYFNENFNGFNNGYAVAVAVAYEDTLTSNVADGLQAGARTTARFDIDVPFAPTTERVGVYVFRIPNAESEYIDTTTPLPTNFLYDSQILAVGSSKTGIGIIKATSASVVSGNIRVVADFEYSLSEQERFAVGDRYVIAFQTETSTTTAGNSDRVMLIVDYGTYVKGAYITGLVSIADEGVLTHVSTTPASTVDVCNEDGLVVVGTLTLDSAKECRLQNLVLELYATDGADKFTLDTYTVDTSASVVANGKQEIDINTERAYTLGDSDEFNDVIIVRDFGDEYLLQIGQKVKWQDWIFNPNANSDFFDSLKPQSNLNFKSSNYSGSGWSVKIRLTANSIGLDSFNRTGEGRDIFEIATLVVRDYDVATAPVTAGAITLRDADTEADTGGLILRNKNTIFEVNWTGTNDISDAWAIHRIQATGTLSDSAIQELSTVVPGVDDILKPISGEYLTIAVNGPGIRTRCLIDFTRLQDGVNYDLSARLETAGAPATVDYSETDYDEIDYY